MMNQSKEKYVLGVDGGGTKSIAAVADLNGKILITQNGASLNWDNIGVRGVKKNLGKLLKQILKKYDIGAAVFGLAGLDTKEDLLVYEKIVKSILPKKILFKLFNDTKIALETLPEEKARLFIISGTGSNVYGEYGSTSSPQARKSAKAGGWGFIVSDEGSAYYFGMEAIRAAIRSFDGRGEKTILEKLVLQKSGKKHMHDLISEIYQIWQKKPQDFKMFIASFASMVDKAYYIEGDRVAKRIIMNGAEELFFGACAVIGKLGMTHEKICVGYVGSNFKAPLLKDLLSDKIKKMAPRAYFVENVEPVKGAIKLALKILSTKS